MQPKHCPRFYGLSALLGSSSISSASSAGTLASALCLLSVSSCFRGWGTAPVVSGRTAPKATCDPDYRTLDDPDYRTLDDPDYRTLEGWCRRDPFIDEKLERCRAVELKAPRLVRRRRAEDTDPIDLRPLGPVQRHHRINKERLH